MSTKIYGGLRSLEPDPFLAGAQLREALNKLVLSELTEIYKIHREALPFSWSSLPQELKTYWGFEKLQTPPALGDLVETKGRLIDALQYRIEALHKLSTQTFADADILYDAALLPNGNPEDSHPLVLIFGASSSRYTEALIQTGVVEEFGYWNNSDQPEGISEDEWECRRLSWSKLDVPATDGLFLGGLTSFESFIALSEAEKSLSK